VKSNTTNKAKKQPPKPRAASIASESSSLSDPDNEFLNKAGEGSTDEDDPDGEEDLDVTGMTEQDAWKLLDDEVQSFLHYLILFYSIYYTLI